MLHRMYHSSFCAYFTRRTDRWLFLLLVAMTLLEGLLMPNLLLHPGLQSYAEQIFFARLILVVVGLGGICYFAWQRDFRYLPVPLFVLTLPLLVRADVAVARVLLNWGLLGQGGFHDYGLIIVLGILAVLTLWAVIWAPARRPAALSSAAETVHVSLADTGGQQLEFNFNRRDAVQLAQARGRILDFLDQPPHLPD